MDENIFNNQTYGGHMRKVLIAFTVAAVALSACGSSKSSSAKAAPTTTASTVAKSSTTAAAATASTDAYGYPVSGSASSSTPTTASTAAAAAATSVDIMMSEWKIEAGPIKAGTVTLNVKNGGKFPHELVVFKGTFASLPKLDNGSINENAIPAGGMVGKVDRMDAGGAGSATLNLPPGQYALACNLVAGGISHAAKGQVLDITVS